MQSPRRRKSLIKSPRKSFKNARNSFVETSGSPAPTTNENIHKYMIEILSCRDLLSADRNGYSDPYVKISLGGRELHRTKHVRKTLNPIFNDVTILKCDGQELQEKGGLEIIVKDWDIGIKSNVKLGTAILSYEDLNNAKNNTGAKEFRLVLDEKDLPKYAKTTDANNAGFVKIRCRRMNDSSTRKLQQQKESAPESAPESSGKSAKSTSPTKLTFDQGKKSKEKSQRLPAPQTNERIECMIEIMSCRDLLPADRNGFSDPYVKVSLGDDEIHRTKHLRKTLNPKFNDALKSKFVLECKAKKLHEKGGLEVNVKDWDIGINSNDRLGTALLPYEDIYNASNTAREYRLTINKKDVPKFAKTDASGSAGYVKIRCRNLKDSAPIGTSKKQELKESATSSPSTKDITPTKLTSDKGKQSKRKLQSKSLETPNLKNSAPVGTAKASKDTKQTDRKVNQNMIQKQSMKESSSSPEKSKKKKEVEDSSPSSPEEGKAKKDAQPAPAPINEKNKNSAVLRIQRFWRRYNGKSEKLQKEKEAAISSSPSSANVKKTKKNAQSTPAPINKENETEQLKNSAVIRIQKHWRGYNVRRNDKEDDYEPLVKDQARGAAWAGGISGLILLGPIGAGVVGAGVLGLGGYAVARINSGSAGSFSRKTGDFTNRLAGVYSKEWRNSKNEYTEHNNSEMSTFCHKWAAFTTRIAICIEDNWEKSGEVPEDEKSNEKKKSIKGRIQKIVDDKKSKKKKKSLKDGKEEKKKKISFFARSKNFVGRIGMSIKETWDESESLPLKKEASQEEENSVRTNSTELSL